MEKAITEARNKQNGDDRGKPVELDFKLHAKETLKVNFGYL